MNQIGLFFFLSLSLLSHPILAADPPKSEPGCVPLNENLAAQPGVIASQPTLPSFHQIESHLGGNDVSGQINSARRLARQAARGEYPEAPADIYHTLLALLYQNSRSRHTPTFTDNAIAFAYELAQLIYPVLNDPDSLILFPERIEHWRFLERLVTFVEYIHKTVDIDLLGNGSLCRNNCPNHSVCGNHCASRSAEMQSRFHAYYAEAVLNLVQQTLEHFYFLGHPTGNANPQTLRDYSLASLGSNELAPLVFFERGSLEVLRRVWCSPLGNQFTKVGFASKLLSQRRALEEYLAQKLVGYLRPTPQMGGAAENYLKNQGHSQSASYYFTEPDSTKKIVDDTFSDTYNFVHHYIQEWTAPVRVEHAVEEHYIAQTGVDLVERPNPNYCRTNCCRTDYRRTIEEPVPRYEERTRTLIQVSFIPSEFPDLQELLYNAASSTDLRRCLRSQEMGLAQNHREITLCCH